MIVGGTAGTLEGARLDNAIPRATLPVIFLSSGIEPWRNCHQEAAT